MLYSEVRSGIWQKYEEDPRRDKRNDIKAKSDDKIKKKRETHVVLVTVMTLRARSFEMECSLQMFARLMSALPFSDQSHVLHSALAIDWSSQAPVGSAMLLVACLICAGLQLGFIRSAALR